MSKRTPPKNILPVLVAARLSDPAVERPSGSAEQRALKVRLKTLGFTVRYAPSQGGWKAVAQFRLDDRTYANNRLKLVAIAPTLGTLVDAAQCIWNGMHA